MHLIGWRAIMAAGIGAGLGLASPGWAKPVVGQPAPKFTLHTFDHKKVALADLAGKVVVLNYWAIWCGPCKAELPQIDAYVRAKASDDLKVFAVTIDETVSDNQLKPLASVLSFPLATRIDGPYGPIGGAIPTNFVIDRNGVLRYAEAAAFNAGTFGAVVGPLLAEAAAPSMRGGAAG